MTAHRSPDRLREDLLSAAIAHARRGWHVFPLRPAGKRPALHGEGRCPHTGHCGDAHQGWEQRATTDPARIRTCWTHGSAWNIGIACGPSRLVVIDLDTPKATAVPRAGCGTSEICNGAGVLAGLYQQNGQPWPPATFTVATPSGCHLYFTAPPGLRLRNTAGRLGWCIDTRAAGGYIVAAGSIVAGHAYTVIDPADPVRSATTAPKPPTTSGSAPSWKRPGARSPMSCPTARSC